MMHKFLLKMFAAVALQLISATGALAFESDHFTCLISKESPQENTLYAGEFDVRDGRLSISSSELRVSLRQENRLSNSARPDGLHYFENPAYLMLTFRNGALIETRFDDEPHVPQATRSSQFKVKWLGKGRSVTRDEAPKYDGLRVRSVLPQSATSLLQQNFDVEVALDGKPIGAARFRAIDVERVLQARVSELAADDAMFEAQDAPSARTGGALARYCSPTLAPSKRPPPPPPPPGE